MRNKIVVWVLLVALAVLTSGTALCATKKDQPSEPPPPPKEPEIVFLGKVFPSLKRRVDLSFKGTITALLVQSGQKVKAGDILVKYRLSPEAAMQIRQRLFPPQIVETETKLREVERSLVPLRNKQRELNQLAPKKLAPSQSLDQANQEVSFLTKEKAVLQDRLRHDKEMAKEDLEILKEQLGSSLQSGQVPKEAALRSPIDGYVIWVNPEVRQDAELLPMPAALQVAVMDPMLVRGQAFEIEALQINPGEEAEVTLESLPGRKFDGKVSRISWSSLTPGLDQPSYYDVELRVPNPDLVLKEGLKARIVFKKSQ